MTPQVRFLGGFALSDTVGRPVRLPTRKCCALLARLAMSLGHDVPREELAALLWPRSSDANARASLRQEIAVLRKMLAAAGLPEIESSKELVRLKLPEETVDALRLVRLAKDGSTTSARQAVTLYGGPFLSGLNVAAHPFEDWQWVERVRLKTLTQNLYLQLLEQDLAGSDVEQVIATASALLAVEPTQEQGHRALMQAYRRLDRHTEALQQFRRCSTILQRELDTEPSHETVDLADSIRTDMSRPDPARRRAANAPPKGAEFSAPPRDECRTVIVIAAGLAGGDALAADFNPRDLARAQDAFADYCVRKVGAHGGRVTTGAGGAVLACFGYPAKVPSDLPRAIDTARAIAAWTGDATTDRRLRPRAALARGAVLIRARTDGSGGAELIGVARCQAEQLARDARGGEVLISAELRARIGLAYEVKERAATSGRAGGRGFVLKSGTR